jgi:hypothetical protein
MPTRTQPQATVDPVAEPVRTEQVELSLVAPVYNEKDNLGPLYRRVCEVFGERTRWELVLVDDGSTDGSTGVMKELRRNDPRVRCVFFARNCGQTSAMRAGIESARAARGDARRRHAERPRGPAEDAGAARRRGRRGRLAHEAQR